MGAGASVAAFDNPFLSTATLDNTFAPTTMKTNTKAFELQFVEGSGAPVSIQDKRFPDVPGMTSWFCTCTPKASGLDNWNVHVSTVPSTAGHASNKIALLLHSVVGKNRCSALFAKYCPPLVQAGYDIIAIDFPGYGRSGDRPTPAHSSIDEELVLVILKAFGVSDPNQTNPEKQKQDNSTTTTNDKEVTVIGAGGGCGTFAGVRDGEAW